MINLKEVGFGYWLLLEEKMRFWRWSFCWLSFARRGEMKRFKEIYRGKYMTWILKGDFRCGIEELLYNLIGKVVD